MDHYRKNDTLLLADEENLSEALRHGDRETKYLAAIQLGKRRERNAADSLIQLLDYRDSLVVRAAAYALGTIQEGAAFDPLVQLLNDKQCTKKCRKSVANALGKLGDPRAVKYLSRCFNEADPKLRRSAAIALGHIGHVSSVDRLVKTVKTDTHLTVKRAAIQSLSKIQPRGFDALTKLLFVDDPVVQLEVMHALAQFQNPTITNKFIPLLVSRDRDVRKVAREELEKQGVHSLIEESKARDLLIQFLTSDDFEMRLDCIKFLSHFPDPQVLEIVLGVLRKTDDIRTRETCIESLGAFADPIALETVFSYLSDQNYGARQSAVRTLAEMGDASIEYLITSLMGTKDERSCKGVIDAIRRNKSPERVGLLIPWLSDANRRNQMFALFLLGEFGTPECVEPILKLLAAEDPEIRVLSTLVLGRIGKGNAQVKERLESLLHDSAALMRFVSAEALVLYNGAGALDILDKAISTIEIDDLTVIDFFSRSASRNDPTNFIARVHQDVISALARREDRDSVYALNYFTLFEDEKSNREVLRELQDILMRTKELPLIAQIAQLPLYMEYIESIRSSSNQVDAPTTDKIIDELTKNVDSDLQRVFKLLTARGFMVKYDLESNCIRYMTENEAGCRYLYESSDKFFLNRVLREAGAGYYDWSANKVFLADTIPQRNLRWLFPPGVGFGRGETGMLGKINLINPHGEFRLIPVNDLDAGISRLVRGLIAHGILTSYACDGHGERPSKIGVLDLKKTKNYFKTEIKPNLQLQCTWRVVKKEFESPVLTIRPSKDDFAELFIEIQEVCDLLFARLKLQKNQNTRTRPRIPK